MLLNITNISQLTIMNKTLINDKYLLSDILFECKCVLYFIDVSKTASFNYIRNINKKINTKSSEIGKTCLVRRYIKDSFNEHTNKEKISKK